MSFLDMKTKTKSETRAIASSFKDNYTKPRRRPLHPNQMVNSVIRIFLHVTVGNVLLPQSDRDGHGIDCIE